MSVLKKTVLGALYGLRVALFLVMYFLRMPVFLISRFLSVPTFLIGLFSFWAMPDLRSMSWTFIGISFFSFVGMWVWDLVMMKLAPHDMAVIN